MTPEDVIFSFDVFKKNSPMYPSYYRHVVKAEKTGEHEIKFTFDAAGQSRTAAASSAKFRCCRSTGGRAPTRRARKRDITATTLETPLGSGPYRIKEFVAGRTLVLERVKDYWGEGPAVSIGQNNFDELRYEYFRDTTVALEAFKGDQVDWIAENAAPRTGRRATISRGRATSA